MLTFPPASPPCPSIRGVLHFGVLIAEPLVVGQCEGLLEITGLGRDVEELFSNHKLDQLIELSTQSRFKC